MKERLLPDVIKEYQNWITPCLIIIIMLIFIVFWFFIIGYNITVILAISTSLILAVTTILVMLITSAENRKNLIFQIRYEHDLKQLIKFKKCIRNISDVYGTLTIYDHDERYNHIKKHYLFSTDYLIWMFIWLYANDEFLSQLPKIVQIKLDEVDEYYSQKYESCFMPDEINEIIDKINSTKLPNLRKYPLLLDSYNKHDEIQTYYEHVRIIKKLIDMGFAYVNRFQFYKCSTDKEYTKMIVFFNEMKSYFDENSFEQIIYDDIEWNIDINISYFD